MTNDNDTHECCVCHTTINHNDMACMHTLCTECYCKIRDHGNGKCPCCRVDFVDKISKYDRYDTEYNRYENSIYRTVAGPIITPSSFYDTNNSYRNNVWFTPVINTYSSYYEKPVVNIVNVANINKFRIKSDIKKKTK